MEGSAVILLVDDEVRFVDTVSKRLDKRNITVIAAYSGPEALARLEQEPRIDVVVLDVKMPGMDGMQTLREIRRLHPATEVIMLTGHATVESGIEGMKLGAFDYMMKPCNVEELAAKIHEAHSKKQAGGG